MLIRLLRTYLRPYIREVAFVVVLVSIQSVANLYLPNLNADIINNGVAKGDVPYIWHTGAVMLAVAVGMGIIAVIGVYFASTASMGVGRDLRGAVFGKVQTFSARELNQLGTASLITRNTNDVQQIQLFLQIALTLLVAAPIMAVGGVIMALRVDVQLSGLLLVILPIMAAIVGFMLLKGVPLFRVMQVKIDRINQVLREQIMGVRVIRAFNRTDYERERFETANADLTSTALRVNRIFVVAFPALMAVMNLTSVAVLWFGGHLVDNGSMSIGNLTAFMMYIIQILFSVMMAVAMVILVPRAEASAGRIQEVLRTVPSISDPSNPNEPAASTGIVEFKAVTFGYPGGEHPVLEDLNFELRAGQTTAIIGGTGSGKTTLLDLIPRFFDVSAGTLLVDGVDVRQQSLERLWSVIGLVPQRAYLFSGTVADNLRFGNEQATDEELWHALEVAQAREFVAAMAEGLASPIDQGGTNVSGGQRQRLAIARALVKRPSIYLFDDCFSALDAGTDARLRAALRPETKTATVVIVAQRVSTIMQADRIIVLDDGCIVGLGTHTELMASCEPYREIVDSQLGEAAVA
ncbi:MAG TPA: ABC transporter ATP-binding protein [Candidatus Acidoferrum sp.]|jgi:ATP-binding cassette subfamily B multidrug efflux pump|nr:ABC transporter ATP-binding protein [Candidatus Acidoferrum sp.]